MTRFLLGLFATGWCAFWAGVLLHSDKYAPTPFLTVIGLVFIFVGWLSMMHIAGEC